jgi:serpin B
MLPLRKSLKMTLLYVLAMLFLMGSGPRRPPNGEIPEISDRINAFTLDLLKRYAQGDEAGQNAILSPQSIFHGLAISYVASGGQTRKELARVLHFPDDDGKLLKDLADLRGQFEATAKHKKADVVMANALWLDSTYAEFRKDYTQKVEKAFSASLHSTKFADGAEASDEINHWVSEKTHGKITGTVGPDDFRSQSWLGEINEPALVSVNAVYFKADWGSRFEKGETRDRPFHASAAKTENTPMMHQRSLLPYAESNEFQFLEIPYMDGQYSMYLLLPRKILGVKDLMSHVTARTMIDLERTSIDRAVDVLLPKFEVARHYDVKNQLTKMGVSRAFDKGKADFVRMIVPKREAFLVYLSEIYHDTWIKVHEEGTEAAAVTTTVHYSVGCSASKEPPPADFHADHPFLFAIVHNQSNSILFAGWIANPDGLTPPVQR